MALNTPVVHFQVALEWWTLVQRSAASVEGETRSAKQKERKHLCEERRMEKFHAPKIVWLFAVMKHEQKLVQEIGKLEVEDGRSKIQRITEGKTGSL